MTQKNDNKPQAITVAEGTHQVSCDGGGGALGHPRVYYTFDGKDEVVCGYCGRVFSQKKHA